MLNVISLNVSIKKTKHSGDGQRRDDKNGKAEASALCWYGAKEVTMFTLNNLTEITLLDVVAKLSYFLL